MTACGQESEDVFIDDRTNGVEYDEACGVSEREERCDRCESAAAEAELDDGSVSGSGSEDG